MFATDYLHLQGLSVVSHIGVPYAERQLPQHLKLNVTLWPVHALTGLNDDFPRTLDYAAVATHLRTLASAHPRQLIETLAEELIDSLMTHFPLRQVQLQVEKFILPETDYVRVSLTKARPHA